MVTMSSVLYVTDVILSIVCTSVISILSPTASQVTHTSSYHYTIDVSAEFSVSTGSEKISLKVVLVKFQLM